MSATGYNHVLRTSPTKQNIPFSVHRAAMAEINIILFVAVSFLFAAVLFPKIIVLPSSVTKPILPHSRFRS